MDLLFLMNLMKIIKWRKIILSLVAYEKLIHLIFIYIVATWHCQVSCPTYRNVPSFSLILILLLLCLPLSHSLCYSFLQFYSNYFSLSPSFSICTSLFSWSSVTLLFYHSLCLTVFISLDFFYQIHKKKEDPVKLLTCIGGERIVW